MVGTVASQQKADGFTPAAVLNPEAFLSGACMFILLCVYVYFLPQPEDIQPQNLGISLVVAWQPVWDVSSTPFHLPVTLCRSITNGWLHKIIHGLLWR